MSFKEDFTNFLGKVQFNKINVICCVLLNFQGLELISRDLHEDDPALYTEDSKNTYNDWQSWFKF